jgi:hypothetical protein
MATTFNNSLQSELGTTEVNILSVAANERVTVIGLSFANLTDSVILASVRVQDVDNSKSAFLIKNIPVPPNQSLRVINGGEKLILSNNTNIFVKASQNASLDMIMSYVTIT